MFSTDAALHPLKTEISFGILITDHNRHISGSMTMMDHTPLSPLVAEINAILQGF